MNDGRREPGGTVPHAEFSPAPNASQILVVDDEPKIGQLLERLLAREGYSVTTSTDGPSALKEIISRRPDLLITDLKMPGMDGLELMRRARTVDPDLPVVMVTGYASMETAVAAIRDGVDDYITKPFSMPELKTVVGRILQNRALAQENRRLLRDLTVANAELLQHRERLTVKVRKAEDGLVVANEAVERRLIEMEVLREIGQMTGKVMSEEELLPLASQLIRDKVGLDAVAVFVLHRDSARLVARGVRGLPHGLVNGDTLDIARGAAGFVVRSGEALLLPRIADDSRPTPEERLTFGEQSTLLLVPVRVQDRVVGVLGVSRSDGNLGDEERDLLLLIAHDLAIALENARLFAENERNHIEILAGLVVAMEKRDPYLREHSERVRIMALDMATALGLPDAERDILDTGARLHDLGKVGIADAILLKEGDLDADQWSKMRSHPEIWDQIVRPLGSLEAVKPIIRHHHEKWDGSGYPDQLCGEEIPHLTQIVTLVDAFEAMTARRPYRGPLTEERALQLLRDGAGTQFNPFLVEVFREVHGKMTAKGGNGA